MIIVENLKNEIKIPIHLKTLSLTALITAGTKVRALISNHPDYFPLFTEGGKWKHDKESWTNWCEGFLGGQMWIFADHIDKEFWLPHAKHYSKLLKGREFDRDVHDLGFIFWPTWKKWLKVSGDLEVNEIVIQAGKTMSLRFNEKAGFFRSFLAENSTFIDIMMNVGIIYYAAQQTNDDEILRKVNMHVLQSCRHLVRGDGSTTHEGIFDVRTGVFLHQQTIQGWRNDSTWARGQAWALYGFGTSYAFTNDARFLKIAQETADFFIEHAGDQIVPPNDFEEPNPTIPFETSAGAIAASGLLQLSQLVNDRELADKYAGFAFKLIEKLCSPEFLSNIEEPWEGSLKHGTYHTDKKLGVDESVMFGEYFLVEALDKILGGPWVTTEQ